MLSYYYNYNHNQTTSAFHPITIENSSSTSPCKASPRCCGPISEAVFQQIFQSSEFPFKAAAPQKRHVCTIYEQIVNDGRKSPSIWSLQKKSTPGCKYHHVTNPETYSPWKLMVGRSIFVEISIFRSKLSASRVTVGQATNGCSNSRQDGDFCLGLGIFRASQSILRNIASCMFLWEVIAPIWEVRKQTHESNPFWKGFW